MIIARLLLFKIAIFTMMTTYSQSAFTNPESLVELLSGGNQYTWHTQKKAINHQEGPQQGDIKIVVDRPTHQLRFYQYDPAWKRGKVYKWTIDKDPALDYIAYFLFIGKVKASCNFTKDNLGRLCLSLRWGGTHYYYLIHYPPNSN